MGEDHTRVDGAMPASKNSNLSLDAGTLTSMNILNYDKGTSFPVRVISVKYTIVAPRNSTRLLAQSEAAST